MDKYKVIEELIQFRNEEIGSNFMTQNLALAISIEAGTGMKLLWKNGPEAENINKDQ
jgi:hypothetical protein